MRIVGNCWEKENEKENEIESEYIEAPGGESHLVQTTARTSQQQQAPTEFICPVDGQCLGQCYGVCPNGSVCSINAFGHYCEDQGDISGAYLIYYSAWFFLFLVFIFGIFLAWNRGLENENVITSIGKNISTVKTILPT